MIAILAGFLLFYSSIVAIMWMKSDNFLDSESKLCQQFGFLLRETRLKSQTKIVVIFASFYSQLRTITYVCCLTLVPAGNSVA